MSIQIDTDGNIGGDAELVPEIRAVVGNSLDRFSQGVTRVEVHLSEPNSDKRGEAEDERRLSEARLEGIQPISVGGSAAILEQTVDGAAGKPARAPDSTLGRIGERQWTTPPVE